jgi:hypothetical protein
VSVAVARGVGAGFGAALAVLRNGHSRRAEADAGALTFGRPPVGDHLRL